MPSPKFSTAAHEQATNPTSWCPEAYWFIYVMLGHDGSVREGARRLLFQALLAGLRRKGAPNRPSASSCMSHSGPLGRYEADKASFTEAGLFPAKYEAACRRAAKRARV